MGTPTLTLMIHTLGMDTRRALVEDVREGLTATPKRLPSRSFWDDRGSQLFERITEQPEYYVTRAEAEILDTRAADVTGATRPEVIVELGAGACTRTRRLLEPAFRAGPLRCFVPFDIDEAIVRRSAIELASEFEGLTVHAIVGDFASHLDVIPRMGRQLVIFLGCTIGNFEVGERDRFLRSVRRLLGPQDHFLLGFDLVKPEAELVAAYDDRRGVSAEFNRNLLRVLNRELAADFDPDAFEHVAIWNRGASRIELFLRALRAQQVSLPGAGLQVRFEPGETVRTGISVKFSRAAVEDSFAKAGLQLREWVVDERQRFAHALAAPTPS